MIHVLLLLQLLLLHLLLLELLRLHLLLLELLLLLLLLLHLLHPALVLDHLVRSICNEPTKQQHTCMPYSGIPMPTPMPPCGPKPSTPAPSWSGMGPP